MLDKTKVALKVEEDASLVEAVAYPTEFLEVMRDYAVETLDQEMKRLNLPNALRELVNDVVILDSLLVDFAENHEVEYHKNIELDECLHGMVWRVLELGGKFVSPYGEVGKRQG